MMFYFFNFEPDIASISCGILIEKFWILQTMYELISTYHTMDSQLLKPPNCKYLKPEIQLI